MVSIFGSGSVERDESRTSTTHSNATNGRKRKGSSTPDDSDDSSIPTNDCKRRMVTDGDDAGSSISQSQQAPASTNGLPTVSAPMTRTLEDIDSDISNVQWTPGQYLKMNPWHHARNLLPTATNTSSPSPRPGYQPFSKLPKDLLPGIVRYLPKESAAALAVTCKEMTENLGTGLFEDFSDEEKWRMLLLLERDLGMLMACQHCLGLHGVLDRKRNDYIERESGSPPCTRTRSKFLPRGITPVWCRLILKSYLRGNSYYGELLSLGPRSKSLILEEIKIFNTTTVRVLDGNLLVKSQVLVSTAMAPNTPNTISGRAAFILNDLTHGGERGTGTNIGGPPCCRDTSWVELGLEVASKPSDIPGGRKWERTPRYTNFLKHKEFVTGHKKEHHDEDNAFHETPKWEHSARCYDSKPVPADALAKNLSPSLYCALFHPQPCADASCLARGVNVVMSCRDCYTDYCFSAVDIEGVGRVLALTTWKDIGGVTNSGDGVDRWSSHDNRIKICRDKDDVGITAFDLTQGRVSGAIPARQLKMPAGSIFARFEGVEGPADQPSEGVDSLAAQRFGGVEDTGRALQSFSLHLIDHSFHPPKALPSNSSKSSTYGVYDVMITKYSRNAKKDVGRRVTKLFTESKADLSGQWRLMML